jgi:hypothetical protein
MNAQRLHCTKKQAGIKKLVTEELGRIHNELEEFQKKNKNLGVLKHAEESLNTAT